MSADSSPWIGFEAYTLSGVPRTTRDKDLLNVGFVACMQRIMSGKLNASASSARVGFVDLSQIVGSGAVGSSHAPCFLQGSVVYSYEFDMVVPDHAPLLILGWPTGIDFSGLTRNVLQIPAGESVDMRSLGVVHYYLYSSHRAARWSIDARHLMAMELQLLSQLVPALHCCYVMLISAAWL